MARTIRSIILSTINTLDFLESGWVSPGQLFSYAQDLEKYTGTQERLLQRAGELAKQKVIESTPRGRMGNNWYRRIQSLPKFTNDSKYPAPGSPFEQ